MRMHVDEAGGDDQALRVDLARGLRTRQLADRNDPLTANGDCFGDFELLIDRRDFAVVQNQVGRLGNNGLCEDEIGRA